MDNPVFAIPLQRNQRGVNLRMNVLEKILEEIEERGNIQFSSYSKPLIAVEDILKIIRSNMDDKDNDGWISVEERLPEDCEEIVLVQVSGKMAENIWFDNAFELATYVNGEGWILENYPECENPKVIAWQPLPEPYKPKKLQTEEKPVQ